MDRKLGQINTSRNNITHFCKWLSWVFYAFFSAYCLTVVLIVFTAVFPLTGFSYIGPNNLLLFMPIICNVAAGGITLFVIAQMLQLVGRGSSPFTLSAAQQIKVLAIVLLVGVISGVLIDPGTQVGSASESGIIAFIFPSNVSDAAYNFRYIDTKALFLSIICFALSPIFRYGAMLQDETDDLV